MFTFLLWVLGIAAALWLFMMGNWFLFGRPGRLWGPPDKVATNK